MNMRKRPSDLLDAYVCVSPDSQSEPRLYFLYAGDGEMRRELEGKAATTGWKSIRFLGFLNQSELPAYYDLCDAFVMPTVFEPWGFVVNEVLNAGKPVIGSDQVGCRPDLVCDGVNGLSSRPAMSLIWRARCATSWPTRNDARKWVAGAWKSSTAGGSRRTCKDSGQLWV